MNDMPLLSLIVPVYKVENYLPKCVDSLLHQTYENLEILLVDDGSPDCCGELCDQLAQKDGRISVIHKENGGLSSARNAGLDRAAGEFVAFVDSDDWLETDAYSAMMALARKTGADLVCGGRYDEWEKTGEPTLGLCPEKEEVISAREMMGRLFIWDQCDSAAWDKLYRRSLFEGIRYPVGKYYEDIPVTYRVIERAGKVAMLPKPVYHYRQRSGSITRAALTEKTFHFEEHTRRIYPYIRDRYPEIEKQARFLRIKSLRFSVQNGDLASEEAAAPFREKIRACRKELRSHTGFLLVSPLYNIHERLEDLAMAWGLFRPIHRLRHPEEFEGQ